MSDVNVITCMCGCRADMPSAVGDYVGQVAPISLRPAHLHQLTPQVSLSLGAVGDYTVSSPCR